MSLIEHHHEPVNDKTEDFNDEIPVWGAEAIGRVIGRSKRQAAYMLETGALKSARKICGRYCAYPSALRREFGG